MPQTLESKARILNFGIQKLGSQTLKSGKFNLLHYGNLLV